MSAIPEWLPLSAELNRKTFTAMENLTKRLHEGQITLEQFSTGVDAVNDVACGLVSRDFIDLVTEAGRECQQAHSIVKRTFLKGAKLLQITWHVGSSDVVTTSFTAGVKTGSVTNSRAWSSEARDYVEMLAKALIAKDFSEI